MADFSDHYADVPFRIDQEAATSTGFTYSDGFIPTP